MKSKTIICCLLILNLEGRSVFKVKKISLNPGENKTVNFILPVSNLSFIGRDNRRVVEPGDFILRVGNLKTKFNVK